ncbi:hypothetical protein T10_2078 [Trichinella papuae]|uniref:Uncharacterized protein n=1 Tax=Trichinella papuae TaxID=268474 RepID=A0A0V1M929_9BILA|nr:hypothetical protein T10_2078 [Trichinella papuae]
MERRKRAPFWNVQLPSFGQRRMRALSLHLLLTQLEPLRLLLIKQTQPSSPYAMSTMNILCKTIAAVQPQQVNNYCNSP